MDKIDHRHVYGIMIDTETANGLDDPLFYDVGWQVIDSHGRVYASRSYVNRDIFCYERDLMRSAYYADKIPKYVEDIRTGKRKMRNLSAIARALKYDVEKYGCVFICAHNARFDYRSLNYTQRYVTQSRFRFFSPYGLEWWDTMLMAESVICPMPTYIKFCQEHGYVTTTGKVRKTAEVLYQFISGNKDFKEEHTGLEDVDIERQILAYCVRQHKPMRKKLWESKIGEGDIPPPDQEEMTMYYNGKQITAEELRQLYDSVWRSNLAGHPCALEVEDVQDGKVYYTITNYKEEENNG